MITNKFKKSQTLDKYMKKIKKGEWKKFKGKKIF